VRFPVFSELFQLGLQLGNRFFEVKLMFHNLPLPRL
jgi:hypothetical protein